MQVGAALPTHAPFIYYGVVVDPDVLREVGLEAGRGDIDGGDVELEVIARRYLVGVLQEHLLGGRRVANEIAVQHRGYAIRLTAAQGRVDAFKRVHG